ncbi:MAG: DUF2157 domain-containing protein [Gemmatimonadetes bacterium]|nr:DUF2157 domain-containing protein [Gemmatimonadota bacterium]NNF14759.1 DUF2157 domain-containing protein [Gemmatimonadota bacterium]
MNRKALDDFATHYGLSAEGVEQALELARARPSTPALIGFCVRLLHLAGVLSLAAGVVFWVAANWAVIGVFGRFALVQAVLAASVGFALWRPPPHPVGRYALLLAFIVTGALFALYGQTYQTGADVHELFLNWALLGLAFVVATQWSVSWAAWTLVLNVALFLFCAARPAAGLFWRLLAGWEVSLSHLLLLPLAVNLLLWLATIGLERSGLAHLAPAWLGRFVLAWAVFYGTWSATLVVVGAAEGEIGGLLVPLAVFAGIAWHTLGRRTDVFPLALLVASLIVLGTALIIEVGAFDEIGMFFVISAWLVVSSTLSGRYLMHLVRSWGRTEVEA